MIRRSQRSNIGSKPNQYTPNSEPSEKSRRYSKSDSFNTPSTSKSNLTVAASSTTRNSSVDKCTVKTDICVIQGEVAELKTVVKNLLQRIETLESENIELKWKLEAENRDWCIPPAKHRMRRSDNNSNDSYVDFTSKTKYSMLQGTESDSSVELLLPSQLPATSVSRESLPAQNEPKSPLSKSLKSVTSKQSKSKDSSNSSSSQKSIAKTNTSTLTQSDTVKTPSLPQNVSAISQPCNASVQNHKFTPEYPPYPPPGREHKSGKQKMYIVGDSHVKRINKDMMKYHLNKSNNKVFIKNFDGATSKHICHHILPILHEEMPSHIVIHAGTNDVSENARSVDIAKRIIDIGKICKNFGVQNVSISSVLHRKDDVLDRIISETNDLLSSMCNFNSFIFISNDNIKTDMLCYDDIHLNQVGTFLLTKNIADNFNNIKC